MNQKMLILIAAAAAAYFLVLRKPGASQGGVNGAVSANGVPIVPGATNIKVSGGTAGAGAGKSSGFGLTGNASDLSLNIPKIWKSIFGSDTTNAAQTAANDNSRLAQQQMVVTEFQVGALDANPPSDSKVPEIPVPQLVDANTADNTPDLGNGNPTDGFDFNP
jgi:hypothetical protein